MTSPASFVESYYLQSNPDVLAAVIAGQFSSGYEHFVMYGNAEQRSPNPQFDPDAYFIANADVLSAVSGGVFLSAWDHFVEYGLVEGRAPDDGYNGVFDNQAYLAANPDVAAAVASGVFVSGLDHYLQYGQAEGRVGLNTEGDAFTVASGDFNLTTAIGERVTGTSGNDTFNAILLGGAATLNAFDSVDGAGGVDTMNILSSDSGVIVVPSTAKIQGVDIINFLNEAPVAGTISAAKFVGAQEIWQFDNATAVSGIGDSTTVGFSSTGGFVQLGFTGDSGSIALDGVDNASAFGLGGANLSSLTVSGSAGAVVGFVQTGDASVTEFAATLSSDSLVDLSGLSDLSEFDGSASTGDLTVSVVGLAEISVVETGAGDDSVSFVATGLEVSTGDGADTVDALSGALDASISVGDGDDVINIAGSNSGTTMTLGDGADRVFVDGSLSNITDAGAEEFGDLIISVSDFDGGDDLLDIGVTGARYSLNNFERAQIAASEDLFSAVNIAAASANNTGTPGEYVTFVFEGDSYALVDNDGSRSLSVNDGLLQFVDYAGPLDSSNFI